MTARYYKQGTIVPSYKPFEWEDFRVAITPIGIRGWIHKLTCGRIAIPFFTGCDLTLKLTIGSISGASYEFEYEWTYYTPGIEHAILGSGDVQCFKDNPKNTIIARLNLPWISEPGQYFIEAVIRCPIKEGFSSGMQKVVEFNAPSRDTWTITAFVSIFTLIIGFLLGFVSC
ncbi:MAG: hypothetical protein KAW13_04660 [Dehalococcoidia bacterium]|nr:hypothetical protein [Dehalococcoidia bacterium]